ncbi:conserved hypothetical protein [Vibrio coralliirubri]|uniref:hypothetical protein n=1 Tax=Vibrio coralliirubri TaxID=1516159 RepID=UPI0006350DA2|nr:hypothetical protein [Vibrio coralliirubri]CAH6877627.1 conserved hypothetical protein [Vibrio chagasii]CAH6897186.1 conserved hypothetical protein [Vibrio chagasii]CAH7240868.1 conserved hypothetical protein [Vibrio chagasii]CAH7414629.1 conserved hypothetical protein [Vibrio chagasii]CDU03092.1 conserved hypothetical protein [Vibrio coralliirubri]
MEKRVFYSWQSDLPNNSNRGFINTALEQAIKEITADDSFSMVPFLDRDTLGVTGSPDISSSIFEKIESSDIFVCDISIINSHAGDFARPTPNPNVLIELGYAIGTLGWDKVILVMNSAFGDVSLLPFDLRGRRVLVYSMQPTSDSKAPERKKVAGILKAGIKEILLSSPKSKVAVAEPMPMEKDVDKTQGEAFLKLNTLKSVTYIQEKNVGLIEYAKEYIALERIDLAVLFAVEITFIQEKNSLLIHIAKMALRVSDFDTAQKAIESITYIEQKNALGLELLKRMKS